MLECRRGHDEVNWPRKGPEQSQCEIHKENLHRHNPASGGTGGTFNTPSSAKGGCELSDVKKLNIAYGMQNCQKNAAYLRNFKLELLLNHSCDCLSNFVSSEFAKFSDPAAPV